MIQTSRDDVPVAVDVDQDVEGPSKRLRIGLAILDAAGSGLPAGRWTPRGPLSAFEGLSAMGLGLAVGDRRLRHGGAVSGTVLAGTVQNR
jgi:hypothetical protein